ncbi:amidohydrolase family protein [Cryptosporangium aurantiacum]|uniref:L-fuconolactonase n=1 Tax=Cryptosporangium aurantiacum TaxID=134849 RepID=A0A1M7Q451_9ACTN|nr:amidohydrolase family protein [Cryptosporangium aurantiacum]SHN25033.1 L-fuconolactonase [Cryptosporangium aurantiacum]
MTIVDAHQHLWNPATTDYPWLTPDLTVLDRVFTQSDVAGELRAAGVDLTVLVQAADNVADTENMLREAALDPSIAGVVAWAPLTRPDDAAALLDRWAATPIVGIRHMIHRDPDPKWLLRADVADGLRLLAERGLTFDVCAETPELLAQVPALAAAHPTLTLIVDHLGKPPIRERGWQPWASLLRDAAAAPNVVAKVSGLNTAAEEGWSAASFQPYVDHALEVFGPDRLMYGGDWPFALLAADSYTQIATALFDAIPATARDAVLGATAARIYRLPPER